MADSQQWDRANSHQNAFRPIKRNHVRSVEKMTPPEKTPGVFCAKHPPGLQAKDPWGLFWPPLRHGVSVVPSLAPEPGGPLATSGIFSTEQMMSALRAQSLRRRAAPAQGFVALSRRRRRPDATGNRSPRLRTPGASPKGLSRRRRRQDVATDGSPWDSCGRSMRVPAGDGMSAPWRESGHVALCEGSSKNRCPSPRASARGYRLPPAARAAVVLRGCPPVATVCRPLRGLLRSCAGARRWLSSAARCAGCRRGEYPALNGEMPPGRRAEWPITSSGTAQTRARIRLTGPVSWPIIPMR